jgi:tetratricopeptide (TPR) repeat protein
VTDLSSRKILGQNQLTYQRLKVSLSLNLRRQIFVAVCDDLVLRDRLAAQLQAEFAKTTKGESRRYPRLVSLTLDLSDPNPIVQVAQWLRQFPPPTTGRRLVTMPAFQIMGVEHLTRQSAATQRLFFTHLQSIERSLPLLESSLLIWITQPWFRALPQSAPEFWRCRTGVFEFVGDPTPLPAKAQPSTWEIGTDGLTIGFDDIPPRSPRTPPPAHPPHRNPETPSQRERVTISHSSSDAHRPIIKTQHHDLDTGWPPSVDDDLVHGLEENLDPSTPPFEEQPRPDQPLVVTIPPQAPLTQAPLNVTYATIRTSPQTDATANQATPRVKTSAPLSRATVMAPVSGVAIAPPPQETTPQEDLETLPQAKHSGVSTLEPVPVEQRVTESQPLIAEPEGLDSEAFKRWSLPQQAEWLQRQNFTPLALAGAYRELGNLYRDQIEQGDTHPQVITHAIQAYELALPLLTEDSLLWVDILNDLGSLYWMLSRTPFDLETALHHLKKGILAYQLALTKIDLDSQAQIYPVIQNNLGAAYADLSRHQDPVHNLQLAVQSYEEALRYRSAEVDPQRYASTQNNLGTTYWNLAQQEQPEENLKRAIASYSEALCYYSPEAEPLNYAMIQNNLGTAYWNLAQRERPQDWLALAIASYQIALQYRTLDSAPAAFAATQNNLGTAYWHLATHADEAEEKQESLQQAIAAYEAALQAAEVLVARQMADPTQPAALSFDLFATHNNLGLAYYQIVLDAESELSNPEQSTLLEAAMQHHVSAYQGWEHRGELRQTAFSCLIQTCRTFYDRLGTAGQNRALSLIPGSLLPEILPKLG